MKFIAMHWSEVERREGLIALLHFVMEWTPAAAASYHRWSEPKKGSNASAADAKDPDWGHHSLLRIKKKQGLASYKKIWFCLNMVGLLTAPGSNYI